MGFPQISSFLWVGIIQLSDDFRVFRWFWCFALWRVAVLLGAGLVAGLRVFWVLVRVVFDYGHVLLRFLGLVVYCGFLGVLAVDLFAGDGIIVV